MLRRGHVCDGKINIILQSFTYPPWYSKDKKTWPDWKYVSNLAENELCTAAMRNIITAVTLQIKVTAKNILWRKMLALSKCMPAFYRWRHWIEILTQVSWYPWVHYCVSTFHPCLPVIEWCKLKKLTFSIGRQKMPKKHTKTALAAKILDRFQRISGCRSTYMCYRLLPNRADLHKAGTKINRAEALKPKVSPFMWKCPYYYGIVKSLEAIL